MKILLNETVSLDGIHVRERLQIILHNLNLHVSASHRCNTMGIHIFTWNNVGVIHQVSTYDRIGTHPCNSGFAVPHPVAAGNDIINHFSLKTRFKHMGAKIFGCSDKANGIKAVAAESLLVVSLCKQLIEKKIASATDDFVHHLFQGIRTVSPQAAQIQ